MHSTVESEPDQVPDPRVAVRPMGQHHDALKADRWFGLTFPPGDFQRDR